MTGALLVAVAHGLDLATLLAVVAVHGVAGEANPLAVGLYAAGGPAALVALKVGGVGALLALVRRSSLRLALAVLAGLIGALVNALAWSVLA